jgi:nucleotide-binding universal stress UspA family protein
MREPIIAGVDGSDHSIAAAHYAAELARRRHAPLRLVYVLENVFYGYAPMYLTEPRGITDDYLRDAANETLTAVTREITSAHPEAEVTSQLREGGAAAALIAESQGADVTVIGSRGLGGFAELLLGSASSQVSAHARGTVVVFRPGGVPGGPVLAGFDGSEPAQVALQYAASEAAALNVPLVVACAYWEQPWGLRDEPRTDPAVTAAHRAEAMIEQAVKPLRDKHPGLRVESRTLHSMNPEHSLVEESTHAGLTVVGSRGRGGIAGLLLGSVSRTLVHHAAGPVAVVHPKR